MQNNTHIMGRFTKDPELRYTNSSIAVCSFSVAVDRDIKEKDGTRKTDFLDCIAWRQLGEFIAKNFRKGMLAVIDGTLRQSTWKGDDGKTKSRVEILVENIYFTGKKENGNSADTPAPGTVKYTDVTPEEESNLPF